MDGLADGAGSIVDGLGMIQVLVIAVLIAIVAGALHVLVRKPDRQDAEALQRLAGRRGWTIERKMAGAGGVAGTAAGSGTGYRVEVSPTDGASWSCVVTRYRNVGKGGFVEKTEFEDDGVRLPAGMVVIGPAIPEKEAAAAAMLFGNFDGGLGRLLLSTMLGDEAQSAGDLRLATDVTVAGATVFATSDAPAAGIGATYAPLLQPWLQRHRKENQFPILIAAPERLRIRLRTEASAADDLEAFLDHALETRRRLLSIAASPQGAAGS